MFVDTSDAGLVRRNKGLPDSLKNQLDSCRRFSLLYTSLLSSRSLESLASVAANFIKSELKIESGAFILFKQKGSVMLKKQFGPDVSEDQDFSWSWGRTKHEELAVDFFDTFPLKCHGMDIGYIGFFDSCQKNHNFSDVMARICNMLAYAFFSRLSYEKELNDAIAQATSVEVTHLKSRNRELKEALEARSMFFSQMSHEIRTPLNSIIGISDLIRSQASDDLGVVDGVELEKIDVMYRASSNLLALINDILDLAKLQSKEIKLDYAAFNLHRLVKDVVYLFRASQYNKNVSIGYRIGKAVAPQRMGDGGRLKQVLTNLLSNSLKFTQSGRVELFLDDERGDGVIFRVEDTGVGIPDEKKDSIFHEFHQVENGSAKLEGTGLGLSISQQIIAAMGGAIQVEDNPSGKGSVFSFQIRLPYADEDLVELPEATSDLQDLQHISGEPIILVVDDSRDNQFLIKSIFSKTKFRLQYASNGEEAVVCYRKYKPDLILMDMQMPVMDGMQATNRIRAIESEENAKPSVIVALTADAYNNDLKKYLSSGFNNKLTKPVRKKELLTEVSSYFST